MTHDLPEPSEELIRRYDVPGPRYTSYPTAPTWREDFGPDDLAACLRTAAARPEEPLSLYVHVPFCQELCTYCGCNVVITRDRCKADTYLEHVAREIALCGELLGERRGLSQIHWGGGTPTFLSEEQIEALHRAVTGRFRVLPDAEVAIEIDPVVTSESQLRLLRALGFNRISMGVQDFDEQVQRTVNRIQSPAQTEERLRCARELGFSGVNFDLIYGLPHQTQASWARTLEQVIALRPDRLAIYSFAYVPEARPHQRRLPQAALPAPQEKLTMTLLSRRTLAQAGYRAIGMDHYALPSDELSRAQERRTLWRNFQGYTVKAAGDVVAFGVTGISDVGGAFAQSTRPLSRYYEAVAAGRLPTERGVLLSEDDRRRRALITQLMCNFWVDLGADGARRYERELAQLRPMEADGLLRVTGAGGGAQIEVLPLGQLFLRNVAMVFDAYLDGQRAGRATFSRTV